MKAFTAWWLGNLLCPLFLCAAINQMDDMSLEDLLALEITTASKSAIRAVDIPASVTVVTEDEIAAYGWRTLAEVLQAQVGFSVFSDRIYHFVTNRGFYISNDPNSRILLLVDGHSVVDLFGYYNGHLATVDLAQVSRIEIVRGPQSAVYGTNAMFAVINIITRTGSNEHPVQVAAEAGSFQRRKLSLSYQNIMKNGLELLVQGTETQNDKQSLYFEEYDNPTYPSQGISAPATNEERIHNYSLKLSYGNWSFHGMFNDREKHVPTGIYGGAFNDPATFFRDINQFYELKYLAEPSDKTQLSVRLHTDYYKFRGRYRYVPDPTWTLGPPYSSEYNEIRNQSLGGEIVFVSDWSPKHETVYGLEAKRYKSLDFLYTSENDPEQLLNENYSLNLDQNVISAFLIHNYQPNSHWSFEFGLHYDDYEDVGNNTSLRNALTFSPTNTLLLKLYFGEAFRAPNLWELNGGFFLEGNPQLEPEEIKTWEAIAEITLGNQCHLRTAGFWYALNGTIQAINGIQFENSNKTEGIGFEAEFNWQGSRTRGFANASYVDVTQGEQKERISFTPHWQVKAGLRLPLSKLKSNLGIEGHLMGPRPRATMDTGKLPSHGVINATLSSRPFMPNLDLSFTVRNLLDASYEHPAFEGDLGTYNLNSMFPVYDIPADGRSFRVRLAYRF